MSTRRGAVGLRRLDEADWETFRALRRRALGDAPGAFSSTLADWSGAGDTEARWPSRLAAVPLNLAAELDGAPAGMVGATHPTAGEVDLISMWVAPEARGRGVGDALIDAVVAWARSQGADRVGLDVRDGNAPAIRLYERHGFADTGPSPHRGPADPPERRMVRPV
jgi:ribosomal protein S18 acetylase RimI-like enzyme